MSHIYINNYIVKVSVLTDSVGCCIRRHIAGVLLHEIDHPPDIVSKGVTDDRESYSLAAGIALGTCLSSIMTCSSCSDGTSGGGNNYSSGSSSSVY